MPESIIVGFLELIAQVLLEFCGYFTGRVLVPVLSFGRVRVEPVQQGVKISPRWHGFQKSSDDGRRVVSCDMAALIGILFWVLLLFLVGGWVSTAQAAEPDNQKTPLVYEVYAGGIHAVHGTLEISLDEAKGRYDFVFHANTQGFLASLIPWEGTFESHGWILEGPDGGRRFQPEIHKSTTRWREDVDIKEYRYKKDGLFDSLRVTDEYSKAELREVEADLTDHTTDILSATLQVLSDYGRTGRCEGQAEIFDGKRRFRQNFKHRGEEVLSASKYNVFSGKTAECSVEVTPLGGAWHKKPRGWLSIQEQGRARGTMPTVWIGQFGAGASNDAPVIPAKVRVKTAYGTLFMHLQE